MKQYQKLAQLLKSAGTHEGPFIAPIAENAARIVFHIDQGLKRIKGQGYKRRGIDNRIDALCRATEALVPYRVTVSLNAGAILVTAQNGDTWPTYA